MRNGLLALATLLGASLPFTVSAAKRIVSLGGDITEIVYALGAQADLVAVDSTSRWPVEAQALPDVGYVRRLGAEGILALRPTQVLATHDVGPPTVVDQLRSAGIRLDVLPETRTPAQIAAKIRTVGHLLGRDAAAASLARQVEQRAQQLASRVAAMGAHPRTVFVMSAASGGLMVAGRETAADAAITLAGGDNVVRGYSGYKPLTAESLIALKPEIVLLMDSGDGADVAGVLKLPAVAQTPAGKAGRVVPVDGQALLGFGARTVDAATRLQTVLAGVTTP